MTSTCIQRPKKGQHLQKECSQLATRCEHAWSEPPYTLKELVKILHSGGFKLKIFGNAKYFFQIDGSSQLTLELN